MLTFNGSLKVYVALEPCDMRKSFNTLAELVRNHLQLDPLSGAAFLFTNKSRRLIKILYFDGTGYWVVAKRLEKGTFSWPADIQGNRHGDQARERSLSRLFLSSNAFRRFLGVLFW